MIKRVILVAIMLAVAVLATFTAGCAKVNQFGDRGRYIYDEAGRIPQETEIALAAYLWRLDSKTDYEIVFVFPQEKMDDAVEIPRWFNEHGVGKKKRDNGAAVFVFPEGTAYVAIGSGNDKVSVTLAKTQGERIFADFQKDPMLTLLRFASALGGRVDQASENEFAEAAGAAKDNWCLFILWGAVVGLILFLVVQIDGFQPHDLVWPFVSLAVAGAIFGISLIGRSDSSLDSYTTYGVITSVKQDSYTYVTTRLVCVSTGKTTNCYTVPETHTMYTNDVRFLSYDLKEYSYRFQTSDYRGAWEHGVGELDALSISAKNNELRYASGVNDDSGGKTIGDGVWITSGAKK